MSKGLVRYPGAGCVVEFMQGNLPQIAWVLEEQSGRLRLLLPNRRETNLQAARLLPWIGPNYGAVGSRDAAIEILERHKKAREEFAATCNAVEWWDLAQGELEKAGAEWFADLAGDSTDADVVSACGHVLMACKTHFRFQPPDFEIWPEDMVLRRIDEQENAGKRERLIAEGGQMLKALWDAFTRRTAPNIAHVDESVQATVREMLCARMANPDEKDNEVLWKQISRGLPEDPFLALYLAQGWGLVGPHHNVWLDRAGYDAGDSWSQAHAEEVAALCARKPEQEPDSRVFVSIDASTTRDIDDAFHIEARAEGGWRLTLALACPAAFWNFDGELDRAVQRRATSLYLPEGTSHMLPECLGADAFSLLAGQVRPAFFVTCEVDADGEIVTDAEGHIAGCEPSLGAACLAANLTYIDCEAVLNEQATAHNPALPYAEALHMGLEMAKTREARRVHNGAVIITRPDLQIELAGSEDDRDVDVTIEPETGIPQAHLLVAEHMMLANAALARWALARNLPLLHRTQDVSVPPEFAGVWSDPVDIARVVRVLAPASLETSPRPHAGIGEPAYAPSTSPLRRYPDFINEAQILHMVQHNTPRWRKDELDATLVQLNARLDSAGQAQRFRPRYWKLIHFRHRPDVWWPAIITDGNDVLVTVNLPREQLVVRGRRNLFGERALVGQEVEVRLGKVRPLQGEISVIEVREF